MTAEPAARRRRSHNHGLSLPLVAAALFLTTGVGCGGSSQRTHGPMPEGTEVEVAAIDGVSPEVAITIRGRDDSILIRDDVKAEQLPSALARLLRAPKCTSGEQAIRISGRWLGIRSADGRTEVDLNPPYDVRIKVTETSFSAYERAELFVRVPATLPRPLTREDVRSSLLEGGTLTAVVSCRHSGFVASGLTADPPG